MIKIKPGSEEKDVWPIRNRILDMHSMGKAGWPEQIKVQVEVNPKKKPYVTEMQRMEEDSAAIREEVSIAVKSSKKNDEAPGQMEQQPSTSLAGIRCEDKKGK